MAVLAGSVIGVIPGVSRGQTTPSAASADHREGMVVRVEGADLLIDLGLGSGIAEGSTYRIFRPITIHHPVTGRTLRDRFPFGTIRVASAGVTLSIAHATERLERTPLVGDILVPLDVQTHETPAETPRHTPAPVVAPHAAAQAAPASPPPRVNSDAPLPPAAEETVVPAVPAVDPETQAVANVWNATLGQPPERRIALYQQFLREHPNSRYAASVRQEIAGYVRLVSWLQTRVQALETPHDTPALVPHDANVQGSPSSVLQVGDAASLTFQLPAQGAHNGAVFHVRARGTESYESIALAPEGDGFLRVRVPRNLVVAPGFEWFLELVDAQGHPHPVVGTSSEPRGVDVNLQPGPVEPEAGRSRMDLRAEYADVGSQDGHPEHFTLVEGDFLQRVHSGPLYGYRVGFGVYDGIGQSLAAYSGTTPASESTVVYGYHELEFAASDFVHLMGRIEIGVAGGGVVGGFQARLRIGREQATNIVLGGDIMGDVGQRAFFLFNFFPVEKLPMTAEGEVFNQSIDGGDPMFRFILQAGYRFAPWMVLSARGSYQLRNITHAGPGGGLALTFDW